MHTADIHFDSPFATLAGKGKFAQERRLEQRKVMKEMVEYIKENNIPYFFIAGDLYEQDYICLLYTSPSPRDGATSRMPSSA